MEIHQSSSEGVESLNGLTGAVILAAGSNISLTPSGNTITIASTASSPLTTKGDLFGFSTVNARIPVGANNTFLISDSTQATGRNNFDLFGTANSFTGQQTFGTTAPIFSTMTAGSVLFAGAAGLLSQDNSNLYFYDALNKLAIGSGTTKLSALTITAPASFTLTGTTNVNGSTTVTGTGTKFLTEVGIGDVITISNSPALRLVVTAIASDTSLTLNAIGGGGGTQTMVVYPSIARFDQNNGTTSMTIGDAGAVSIGSFSQGTLTQGLYMQGASNTQLTANAGIVQINRNGGSIFQGLYMGIDTTNASSGQFYMQYMTGSGSSPTVGNGDLILNPRGSPVIVGTSQASNQAFTVGATNNAYVKVGTTNGHFGGNSNDKSGYIFQNAGIAYTTYEKAAIVFDSVLDTSGYGRGTLYFAVNGTQSGANAVDNLSTNTIMNLDWRYASLNIGKGINANWPKLSLRSTFEQNRTEFDDSNYLKTEISPTGTAHITNLGAGSQTIFTDEQTLGTEKVTNGSFTGSATGWTLGAAWAYSSNNVAKNANGTNTLSQTIGAVAGEIYLVTFDLTTDNLGTPGTVLVTLGGKDGATCITHAQGNGTITYSTHILASTTGDLIFTPSNTSRFTVKNVSGKRVEGGVVRANSMKVVTGAKNYTSQVAAVGGTIIDHYADVGNLTATGETDLYTDTLNAGTLGTNGDKLEAVYAGTFVGDATSNQRLKAYFGGTLIFDSGALSIGAATDSWNLFVTYIRESSSIVRCSAVLTTNFATLSSYASYTKVTGLTLANTQIVKITGTAGGAVPQNNQIIASMGSVIYLPAA